MHPLRILCCVLIFVLYQFGAQTSAATGQDKPPYNLKVTVDEVVITFHAAGANALPVNDLKLSEVRLLDNGEPPAKVINFQLLQNLPIRAGILLDTSESMQGNLHSNRMLAAQYAQQLLRRRTDQAFVMNFGRVSNVPQALTSDPVALAAAVRKLPPQGPSGIRGTAIFDSIFRACLYEFGTSDHTASGNFILLFSDGEDNASYASLQDAVNTCQRTNTAIYAFRGESHRGEGSTGPATLTQLTEETGGRVFPGRNAADEVATDLQTIEADLRNQYRLIYKPAALKHDGLFHQIALDGPARVDRFSVRSGYYAPAR